MPDIITFFKNFNYDICLAGDNVWTLEEAIDYLAAFITNKDSWYGTEDAYKAFMSIKEQLSSAVRQSIFAGNLQLCEGYQGDSHDEFEYDFKRTTIVPLEIINWAIHNNLPLPEQFKKYAVRENRKKSKRSANQTVKRSTIHHEKTRAVAEMIWSMLPNITINDMARRPEIRQFGCEGHIYDTRTIARWLASLKVNRKPGRTEHA